MVVSMFNWEIIIVIKLVHLVSFIFTIEWLSAMKIVASSCVYSYTSPRTLLIPSSSFRQWILPHMFQEHVGFSWIFQISSHV
jgi:hypothetical protein